MRNNRRNVTHSQQAGRMRVIDSGDKDQRDGEESSAEGVTAVLSVVIAPE